jgi:serine/threonine-protein kinase
MESMTAKKWKELPVGQPVAGGWVKSGVIGEGGMGVVLEVRKGPLVGAIKLLGPNVRASAELEAQFAREVALTVSLQHHLQHPNIVQVYDCGVLPDGLPYFVMERLQGGTLRAALHRGRARERMAIAEPRAAAMPTASVFKIVEQVGAGLA